MKKLSKIASLVLATVMLFVPVISNLSVVANAANEWVCAWATSIVDSSISLASLSVQDIIPSDSTIRIELRVGTGGEQLRFKFSNEHGAAPIRITEASVARTVSSGEAAIDAKTATPITFGGEASVSVPKGETLWSDAVDFATESLEAISVSLFFENTTYITSAGLSNARTFMGMPMLGGNGSQCSKPSIGMPREINIEASTITYHTTPFLCQIDTSAPEGTKDVAVFIGDSTLVNDTYYYFAEKLVKGGITNISVVNQAVIANKLLSDGTGLVGNLYGEALINRFQRDALDISGVKYIFVKIGLNDILHQFSKSMGDEVPHYSTDDIIKGYKDLIKRAHEKGIKIYFFTKSPWKGYERAFLGQTGDVVWTQEMQDMCDELTRWIKKNIYSDGYIDCSPLANPADPYALCPSFTPDGAHLTPIASVALADLIPVSFVGVDRELRSSARIHKVNPYEERDQIIYEMEHPNEVTTQKAEETTSREETISKREETTTKREEATTKAEITTVKPAESTTAAAEITTSAPIAAPQETTTFSNYIPQEIITVPVIADPQVTEPFVAPEVNPEYNITDTMPETIGNGTPIVFLLVLFFIVIVSGSVLFLTMRRKKQEEFE